MEEITDLKEIEKLDNKFNSLPPRSGDRRDELVAQFGHTEEDLIELHDANEVTDPNLIDRYESIFDKKDYLTELNEGVGDWDLNPFADRWLERRLVNVGRLGATAISQGTLLGFGDEILRNTGLESVDEFIVASQNQAPGASFFAEVVGGGAWLALGNPAGVYSAAGRGVATTAQASTAAGRLGQAARGLPGGAVLTSRPVAYGLEGAAYGGAYGAGTAQSGERLEGAATGAAFGGALIGVPTALGLGFIRGAKLGGKYLLPSEQIIFKSGSEKFIDSISKGYMQQERVGKFALQDIFTTSGKTWIQPTMRRTFEHLDNSPLKHIKDGVITNPKVKMNSALAMVGKSTDVDKQTTEALTDAVKNSMKFSEAADLRFEVQKLAQRQKSEAGRKALDKLSQAIEADIRAGAKAFGVEKQVGYAMKGFDDAAELMNSSIVSKYLQSPAASEKLVQRLSRGLATKDEVDDLLFAIDWARKKLPRADFEASVNRLRAEVATTLLNDNPKKLLRSSEFTKQKDAYRRLFGDKYEAFETLTSMVDSLSKKPKNASIFDSGSLLSGAVVGIGTGIIPGIFTTVGVYAARRAHSNFLRWVMSDAKRAKAFRDRVFDLYSSDEQKRLFGKTELNKMIQNALTKTEQGE